MTSAEKKAVRDLLAFAKGLWAELKDAGYCDKKSSEPWQFKQARAALQSARNA